LDASRLSDDCRTLLGCGVVIAPKLWRDRGASLKFRTSANPDAKTSPLFQFAKIVA
jgi:hypothetical protein